jgi:hypothetical protein
VSRPADALPVVVRNEFAMVEVSVVPGASGPQLQLRDVPGGVSVRLDALELEGLCWLTPEQRRELLDPHSRWSDGEG